MKISNRLYLAFLFLLGALMTNMDDASAQSETERNGFIAEEPLKYIKLSFFVNANEKKVLPIIKDASTSIAAFAKEVMATHANPPQNALKHIIPSALNQLRLPPEASNGADRYVYSQFYCWKSKIPDQIQVQIEWADITTPQRYTDSYVFVKKDSQWYFSHHGDLTPFWYKLDGYNFKRPCSQ